MAPKKEITRIAKIQLVGGQARPGPALASIGINMAEFTKQFNDKTKQRNGEVVRTTITAFNDKSFKFEIKDSEPASVMLKKVAKINTAGKNQLTDKVATITKEQALTIAKAKLNDTNAYTEEAALRMIAGTAKNMGIVIKDVEPAPLKGVKKKINQKLI
ncbi:MAG: 50S ribosomal protein L11 [Mycoplasmataceae bacterium]|jgi:large subunit ribosomal protein L11|nr:50S ribosomal protein L11 [Mycoplasmataceae bacterium]